MKNRGQKEQKLPVIDDLEKRDEYYKKTGKLPLHSQEYHKKALAEIYRRLRISTLEKKIIIEVLRNLSHKVLNGTTLTDLDQKTISKIIEDKITMYESIIINGYETIGLKG